MFLSRFETTPIKEAVSVDENKTLFESTVKSTVPGIANLELATLIYIELAKLLYIGLAKLLYIELATLLYIELRAFDFLYLKLKNEYQNLHKNLHL